MRQKDGRKAANQWRRESGSFEAMSDKKLDIELLSPWNRSWVKRRGVAGYGVLVTGIKKCKMTQKRKRPRNGRGPK